VKNRGSRVVVSKCSLGLPRYPLRKSCAMALRHTLEPMQLKRVNAG
jgi:hypothetical protein